MSDLRKSPARWLVVATEPSGDRLAARVLRAAVESGCPWDFEGVAGEATRAAGMKSIDTAPASAMGIFDVIPGVFGYRALARRLLARCDRWNGALLVDQHAFTLPLGRALRARGVPVTLLSAPQVWAWRPSRARSLGACADAIGCLFDVEPPALRALGLASARVAFVGHPSAEEIMPTDPIDPPRLGLFPGSRAREITRLFPTLDAASREFVARGVVGESIVAVPPEQSGHPALVGERIVTGIDAARRVLAQATVAVACSGTVTLECALAGVPTIVVYRTDCFTAAIARRLLLTPWIALPNILVGRSALPELVQDEVTVPAVVRAVEEALTPQRRADAVSLAEALRQRLVTREGFGRSVVALMASTLDDRSRPAALSIQSSPSGRDADHRST